VVAAYALTQGGNGSSLNPIAQAAVRTQDSSGGKTSISGTVQGQSLAHQIEITGQGVFNGTTNRTELSMTMSGPPSMGEIEMEAIGSGSHGYYRSDKFKSALPDGDEWIGLDLSLGSASETGAISSASPTGQLTMLRAVSNEFEKLGERTVRGVETTGYRSTLDPQSLADYLRGKGSVNAAEQYEQLAKTAPSSTEVETWIDHKGLVRQTLLRAESHDPKSGEKASIEMTVDFYDFGLSPEIQLPDPETVYDATPKLRSELGLGASS
jgi:hypothetical protein